MKLLFVKTASSDDSTIDIMSSGDDHIDIINDMLSPERSRHYLPEMNSSCLEYDNKYIFNNFHYYFFF